MSRRVIPKGLIANQARGNKQFNFPLSSIGARGIGLRNAIINRSTNCCPRSGDGSGSGGGGGGGGGGNENFITLEQALDQGGVNSGQILFLDNNGGLVLIDDFTVQNGGFIILADIENPQENLSTGEFAGIFVPQGKKLTVLGEIVLGIISSDAVNNKDVYGVYNKGTIEISKTGSITMGDISSVKQNAHGIFQESTIQKHTASNTAGAIQMGNITSNDANAFGVKNGQLNDVRVQIGNVSGGNEAAAVNLSDGTTTGNMSAHVIAGDVMNSGNTSTSGVAVNELSGSFSCGNVKGSGKVFGIVLNNTLSGSATCGNVEGTGPVFGIFVDTLNGSASCGTVEGGGSTVGISVFNTLSGSATCGNVEGTGTAAGILVFNTLSGSATCGTVEGGGSTVGISVDTLSGSATCGDVSSTGQSTTDNVIKVTGMLFTTVYPEAQVNIGNISAASGICRGAFSGSETAILAGTTNIGSVSSNVNFDYTNNDDDEDNNLPILPTGGIVRNFSLPQEQVLSDSFISYDGIGKGLEIEVSIDNGAYVVTNKDFTNTTDYVNDQLIIINGAYFGGSNTDNVTLIITNVDNDGQIKDLQIDSTNLSTPPADPRVTSTGVITTNGLSGSFTVKDCSLIITNTSNVDANLIFNQGIFVTNLSGSATCGNVEGTGINGGTINGNVIIKSASIGVSNLANGSGKVIIGAPQGVRGDAGTVDDNQLSAYIYGGSVEIPSSNSVAQPW